MQECTVAQLCGVGQAVGREQSRTGNRHQVGAEQWFDAEFGGAFGKHCRIQVADREIEILADKIKGSYSVDC